jgi:hypothetical protein
MANDQSKQDYVERRNEKVAVDVNEDFFDQAKSQHENWNRTKYNLLDNFEENERLDRANVVKSQLFLNFSRNNAANKKSREISRMK